MKQRISMILAYLLLIIGSYWIGYQIASKEEVEMDLLIADSLMDRELRHFSEYRKHIEDPEYDPNLGSNTIINFHNGVLEIHEQDPKDVFEANRMTIQSLVKSYKRGPWFLFSRYRAIYKRYKGYEKEIEDLLKHM